MFLAQMQLLSKEYNAHVTVSVFGDVLKVFDSHQHSFRNQFCDYLNSEHPNDHLVTTHVHFEGPSRLRPMIEMVRERCRLVHEDRVYNPLKATVNYILSPFDRLFP